MTKRTEFLNDARSFSQDRLSNPFWRGVAIFAIGLVVGWLVFGWLLFPVRYTEAFPNELRPEEVNEYLLMTAESYAATGDLRTAAKRLRFWEPEQLAVMFNQLAQSVETTNPASAAYLRLLARDLHLSTSASKPPPPPRRTGGVVWLIALVLALAILAGLIFIAQKFGLLGQREPATDSDILPQEAAPPHPSEAGLGDAEATPRSVSPPLALSSVGTVVQQETEETLSPDTAIPVEPEIEDLPSEFEMDEFPPDEMPDIPPDEIAPTIPEPEEELVDETPEVIPPIPDEVEVMDDEDAPLTPQVIHFDGDPAFNTIIAIEANDDYLGEYGLSAGQTAPSNPNLAITLEVWLFDKSDTQTTDAALVPPVVATDPALRARYVRENMNVFPLKEGQIFLLETAELRLEGRVRRVQFGATTSDGVPVIESAEIEMLGRRK